MGTATETPREPQMGPTDLIEEKDKYGEIPIFDNLTAASASNRLAAPFDSSSFKSIASSNAFA
jgi:hypothetical protein